MPKQANAIDISEFQDPSTFDYQAAKDAGIDTIIIRGSVSQRLDKFAKQHIANAKKYGFKWHLYHYFYNGSNEINVAINSAKELGLTSDQYLFLDMEDKSLPSDWAGLFEQFRLAVGTQFKVGLYCSDSPFKAKFDNEKLVNEGVYRWIAAYSYEPKNYDMWQMSGAGSGGFGNYKHDVDRDYVANKALNAYANKPDDKPFTPPTDLPEETKNIVLQDMVVDGIRGLGCSPDNGITRKIYWTIFGRKYYQEDADRLWPFLKNKIGEIKGGSLSVSWSEILNKPDVALKSDLPDMSNYVTRNELPTIPDMSSYAKESDIPSLDGYAKLTDIPSVTGLVKEAELNDYVKKSDLPNIDLNGYVKVSDLVEYAKKTDIPQSMDWKQITGKPQVATQDDIDYLKTLIGSSSSGDAGLSIEAIVELIKHHLKARVDTKTGNLLIDVDDVSNGSIADAVANKVAQSLRFKFQSNELVAEIGGTE